MLECGTQATGGNYSFFRGHDVRRPGFPLAEIHADGTSVITKHDGTGGVVDVGTVTAQLLYETGGARYAGPDVTARLDTVRLTQEGPDRVRISGVRGEAPPPTLKVGLNRIGGWRNEVVFVLTGLDIEAKAQLVQDQIAEALTRTGKEPDEVRWELARTDRADADTEETAGCPAPARRPRPGPGGGRTRRLRGRDRAGPRQLPGLPRHRPARQGRALRGVRGEVRTDGRGRPRRRAPGRAAGGHGNTGTREGTRGCGRARSSRAAAHRDHPARPLGRIAGARSGDKGGDANVGVWVRADDAWRWLAHELTVERFQELLPETAELTVVRHVLPNLRALNFVVHGLLGDGVAAQARFDPQAKAVGEWLRSRHLPVPVNLLESTDAPEAHA